jgi:hypothetical protein
MRRPPRVVRNRCCAQFSAARPAPASTFIPHADEAPARPSPSRDTFSMLGVTRALRRLSCADDLFSGG